MSDDRYIKQAIVASLCERSDAEKYRELAFNKDNMSALMDAFTQQSRKITKADLFAPDDEGKILIDTPGFWKNFEKIHALIKSNGDHFTYDDFASPYSSSAMRSLMDSAEEFNGFHKIFRPEVWEGDYDRMEKLWYETPMPARESVGNEQGYIDIGLKRTVMASEGRVPPEDGLSQRGYSRADFFGVFSMQSKSTSAFINKLHDDGDYFRKEYALMPDNGGDTIFYHPKAWSAYDDVVKDMKAHGERFEVSDFLKRNGATASILHRAAHHKTLDKVFKPDHWKDRLEDMVTLWSHVADGWKMPPMTPAAFDNAYAAAESMTYGARLPANDMAAKSVLLTPVNPGAQHPVRPLGMRDFWGYADTVATQLLSKGEKMTRADFMQPSGVMGETCLMQAAKSGNFAGAARFLLKFGEKLELDDFLKRDARGDTLLNVLADRRQLDDVFMPELWVGRVAEMQGVIQKLRVRDREQIDVEAIGVRVRQATVRQQVKKTRFKLKPD
ncbi:MAG: hypothetical protein OXT65_12490 [Alphaproteobacteria bacterium]|nr:hypothetical protein [Alphaproteobacteria bacterium]